MIGHYHFIIPRAYTGCRLLQDLILFSIMTMSTCYTVIKGVPPPPSEIFRFFWKVKEEVERRKLKGMWGGGGGCRLPVNIFWRFRYEFFFWWGVLGRGLRNFRRGIRNFQGGWVRNFWEGGWEILGVVEKFQGGFFTYICSHLLENLKKLKTNVHGLENVP